MVNKRIANINLKKKIRDREIGRMLTKHPMKTPVRFRLLALIVSSFVFFIQMN